MRTPRGSACWSRRGVGGAAETVSNQPPIPPCAVCLATSQAGAFGSANCHCSGLAYEFGPRSALALFAEGAATLQGPGRGGRHHQNLSLEQEQALLAQFCGAATQGGVLETRAVRAAYETLVGHSVPESTVCRLLTRHGWRKIAPRPRHPKADPVLQEVFKKSSGAGSPASAHDKPDRAYTCA
jgi:transposase